MKPKNGFLITRFSMTQTVYLKLITDQHELFLRLKAFCLITH